MRTSRARSTIATVIVVLLVAVMLPASAIAGDDPGSGSSTLPWTGQGADSIDETCPKGKDPYLHWVLTPGGPFTLSDAVLTVNGSTYHGEWRSDHGKHGAVHFGTAYHDGALEGTLSASVSFDWERHSPGGPSEPNAQLVISDGCTAPQEPKVGEVTVVKAWDLDGAFEDMTEADVSADLDVRVDGEFYGTVESGHTLTGLEKGTIVEIIGESNVTLPDGCTYTNELAGAAWTVTKKAPTGTITLTNVVTCEEVEPDVGEVTVVKAWDGIDEPFDEADFSADLDVRVDGEFYGTVESGHTLTDLELGTIVEIIGESNVTMPDGCTYENELAGAAWTVTKEAPTGTITLVNDVTCVLDEVVAPKVTAEFIKDWNVDADDDIDLGDVDAWLTVNGETVEFGETIDVTDHQNGTLTVEEHVDGLPETDELVCTWSSDLDEIDLSVPKAADEDLHLEITITNDVTCVMDEIAVIDEDDKVVVTERIRDDVTVLGVAQQRLPRTGAPLVGLLIAGLLALFTGGGLLARRRR